MQSTSPKTAFSDSPITAMQLLFVPSPVLSGLLQQNVRAKKNRRNICTANINQTRDQDREDEVAAKIARLRKMKRLKSQKTPGAESQPPESATDGKSAETIRSFKDLPDWKKEQVLEGQIAEAEAFFNAGSSVPKSSPSPLSDEEYQPKVSTWGVFRRPDNISRRYGGGKKIPLGGVDLNSDETKQQDENIAKQLAAYRAARGIDVEREKAHEEEIQSALDKTAVLMARSSPYEAIRTLQSVEEYISDQSRLGGQVLLQLGLAYDSVGKREEARKMYIRLKQNAFPEISSKAKQLLQGFEAMDMLRVQDETEQTGFRVTQFRLPELAGGTEKRYETAVASQGTKQSSQQQQVDLRTNLLLALVVFGPLVLILALAKK